MTLLNDPTFIEAARVFAAHVIQQGGDSDQERINFAFIQATSRDPEAYEVEVLQDLLNSNRRAFADRTKEAQALTSTGLTKTEANLEAVELAAWTEVTRALLNLNEVVTRN
jgi:hypothetical protein